ncbi:N-glycosyltransferase [Pseudonocardia ammonioxydans]|uniref:N-glycosyltransferase n=2 Tax=Pseudonocardia ammonioxydans TaxID=260086 RepID=A0A1I5IHA8_PSUAM|nr:N-glycosyltransferase [Pseudonocardia ammonioxydans]
MKHSRKLRQEFGISQPQARPGVTAGVDPETFARGFVRVLGSRFAVDLVEALSWWKPDVVLRESTEYGGYLAAEYLGIPHGALDIAPMAPYGARAVLDELNDQRAVLGLPGVADPLHPLRGFRASVVPEAFHPVEFRIAEGRHYRPPEPVAPEPLDAAVAELPADRPLVLASLGSNAGHLIGDGPSPLDAIIEALGQLPVTAVVALGVGQRPEQWQGPRADNVHLTSFVQQKTLLAATDVFISHCGFNGTCEALTAGVPMIGIPLFAEQPANAARIEQLGAGVRLNVEDLTVDSLSSTLQTVLADATFSARAKGIQRQTLALPPTERLIYDLEKIAS